MDDYWETVGKGKSGKLVKIKIESEASQTKNQYEALTPTEGEDDVEAWEKDDVKEKELEKNKPSVPDITTLTTKHIEGLSKIQVSELVYMYKHQTVVTLPRGEIYDKNEEELRSMLEKVIQDVTLKSFIKDVKEVAQRIRTIKKEEILSKISTVIDIMRSIVKLSELKEYISAANVVTEFKKTKEAIKLIEQYQDDEMIMIPEHLLNLKNCGKEAIGKANYYVLALAVLNIKGNPTKVMNMSMSGLREHAHMVYRNALKKKSEADESNLTALKSPPKKVGRIWKLCM